MSSAMAQTVFQRPSTVLTLASAKNLFRLKLTAQTVFGILLLLDSLFLILCYITFDFYGALNSPFFGWLRNGALGARVLYFPAFAAALLTIDIGLSGRKKLWIQRLAGILLVSQILLGLVLYFLPGQKEYFAWVMLYGPNVRTPAGDIVTYCESIACLIPLVWISVIHIAASYRAAGQRTISESVRLGPFLAAGLTTSLLYMAAARLRMSAGSFLPWTAVGFNIAAHVSIFLMVFLVLHWFRVIASWFPDPGLAQFALRCLAAWAALGVVIRKMIFALLAFNNHMADGYAAIFSFAIVLFSAAIVLKLKEQRSLAPEAHRIRLRLPSGMSRILAGAAILALFYVFAVKLASVDWEHVIGNVSTLVIGILVLRFWSSLWHSHRSISLKFLLLVSLAGVCGFLGVRFAVARPDMGDIVEQYASYDPSTFVVQNALKPALQDEKYAAWYDFLGKHAGIRAPISAPEVPLANELKPVSTAKPNIFIFVIDALRRDYVSSYNPAVNFTPHMHAFAQESTVFQHAYSFYAGTALADPAIWSGFQQLNKIFVKPLSRENNLQPMLKLDGYHSYISYNPIVAALVDKSDGVTGLSTDLSDRQQKEFSAVVAELEDDLMKRKDPERPIFAFSQPANVHTLSLAWHGKVDVHPHPGFDDKYASAVEKIDQIFGDFVDFLKKQGLYENSVIIVTADHGESLGEMGRESHVSHLTPEVIEIPLIIHLPAQQKSRLVWNAQDIVSLHDITPTLYYLVGHRELKSEEMLGRSLFTHTWEEQKHKQPDHYFLMSSYGAIFGILSSDMKGLFYVDATLRRNYYYDLQADPHALKNRVTVEIRDRYEQLIRQDLEKIDRFYGVSEQELE